MKVFWRCGKQSTRVVRSWKQRLVHRHYSAPVFRPEDIKGAFEHGKDIKPLEPLS